MNNIYSPQMNDKFQNLSKIANELEKIKKLVDNLSKEIIILKKANLY